MEQSAYLAIELVDTIFPGNQTRPAVEFDERWRENCTSEQSEAIGHRNADIVAHLSAELPGLEDARERFHDPVDYAGDGISQDELLRRYHRSQVLAGPWGERDLIIQVFDNVTFVSVSVNGVNRYNRPRFIRDLSALLEIISRITGMTPIDEESRQARLPGQAAEALVNTYAGDLNRLSKAESGLRWKQRLGVPSLIILTVLTAALTMFIAWHGMRTGAMMVEVDPDSAQTFITKRLPEIPLRLGFIPDYKLDGFLADSLEPVELSVGRAEFIRAGPGAPFTVVATGNTETPYVLRTAFDKHGFLIELGGIQMVWYTTLALLPPLLWLWFILRPLLMARGPELPLRWASVTGMLVALLQLGGLILALLYFRGAFD